MKRFTAIVSESFFIVFTFLTYACIIYLDRGVDMSDIRVLNYKKKEVYAKKKLDPKTIQSIVETQSVPIFGAKFVASNYILQNNNREIIDTLLIDENNQLVIVEYRMDVFGQVVNKALFLLDYMQKNKSEFKILLTDVLGSEYARDAFFPARILVIGEDFNRYDEHAIAQLGLDISLVKCITLQKDLLVFEQSTSSVKIEYNKIDSKQGHLIRAVSDFILSLGDEVSEVSFGAFTSFRKMQVFAYLLISSEILTLRLKEKNGYKAYEMDSVVKFEKVKAKIVKCYESN